MRTTRTRNAVAAVLAGALMAVASPAIAHDQSPQSNDWTPLTLSTLRAEAAAQLRDRELQVREVPAALRR